MQALSFFKLLVVEERCDIN